MQQPQWFCSDCSFKENTAGEGMKILKLDNSDYSFTRVLSLLTSMLKATFMFEDQPSLSLVWPHVAIFITD